MKTTVFTLMVFLITAPVITFAEQTDVETTSETAPATETVSAAPEAKSLDQVQSNEEETEEEDEEPDCE